MPEWCHVVGCWESDVEDITDGIDKEFLCADCDGCEEVEVTNDGKACF